MLQSTLASKGLQQKTPTKELAAVALCMNKGRIKMPLLLGNYVTNQNEIVKNERGKLDFSKKTYVTNKIK